MDQRTAFSMIGRVDCFYDVDRQLQTEGICSIYAPLLKKESDPGVVTVALKIVDPLRLNLPSARAAFASGDDPVD